MAEFEAAGRRATVALWQRRSKLHLVGNHLNIKTGAWTHSDAGGCMRCGVRLCFASACVVVFACNGDVVSASASSREPGAQSQRAGGSGGAGLGTNIDSFYEYLIKAHFLIGDTSFLPMFHQCYQGIMTVLKKGAWYLVSSVPPSSSSSSSS